MTNRTHIDESPMRIALNFLTQASVPYVLLVAFIGIGGNFLTILMLAKRSLSRNFNNCTLIALALTDLLFNLTLVWRCVNDVTQFNGETLCRFLSFISHLAELLSACFTAQFTAQRFIAVRFPLSVFIEKRIHLIHYFIVLLLIVFGVSFCFALVYNNSFDKCHEELELSWFVSDALFSFLIPFTLIIVLNLLIIIHLKKSFHTNQLFRFRPRQQTDNFSSTARTETYELTSNVPFRSKIFQNESWPKSKHLLTPRLSSADASTSNGRARSVDLWEHASSSLRGKSQSYRVTRMLIIVSTCFLLLNAPAHITSIGMKMYTLNPPIHSDYSYSIHINTNENSKSNDPTSSEVMTNPTNNVDEEENFADESKHSSFNPKSMQYLYLSNVVFLHVSYASYSINFFLYSFCGMKFRRELIRCMSKQNRANLVSRSLIIQNTS